MLTLLLVVLIVMLIALSVSRSTIDTYSPMDLDFMERKRLAIYLGSLDGPIRVVLKKSDPATQELLSFDPKHPQFYADHPALRKHGNSETIYDFDQLYQRFNVDRAKLVKICAWADSIEWFSAPTIAKTRHRFARRIPQQFCVLMRLRSRPHFGSIRKDTVAFEDKKNIVFWRGGPSGPGFKNKYEPHLMKPSREEALRRWALNPATQKEIDLGLTKKWNYHDFTKYVKPELGVSDMFRYKYLLSIEGNDVATNLKWALASNSVVLMPQPYVESWFTESLLEPYVHYVPVQDDFSDLLDQKRWCDAHPDECKRIVARAQAYVQPFLNVERECYLSFRVLQKYMDLVHIEVTNG